MLHVVNIFLENVLLWCLISVQTMQTRSLHLFAHEPRPSPFATGVGLNRLGGLFIAGVRAREIVCET